MIQIINHQQNVTPNISSTIVVHIEPFSREEGDATFVQNIDSNTLLWLQSWQLRKWPKLLHSAPLPPREILIKSGVRREGRSSAHIYEEWQCSCALTRERGFTYVFLLWYKFCNFTSAV